MILLLDIGNTAITIACYDGKVRRIGQLITKPHRLSDEYGILIDMLLSKKGLKRPDNAIIASVVPSVTNRINDALKEYFNIEPITISYLLKSGLIFSVKRPEQVGIDRIVNASAAHKFYPGTLIVVDCGTATTFCAITEDGQYCGGPILPGPPLMAQALAEKTAALPYVEIESPLSVIGSDTKENILSGVIFGHAGAIEKIIYEMKKKLNLPVTVIGTGGFLPFVAPLVNCIDEIDRDLTIKGLHIIYEMNKKKTAVDQGKRALT